jgi:hypothetical protein
VIEGARGEIEARGNLSSPSWRMHARCLEAGAIGQQRRQRLFDALQASSGAKREPGGQPQQLRRLGAAYMSPCISRHCGRAS